MLYYLSVNNKLAMKGDSYHIGLCLEGCLEGFRRLESLLSSQISTGTEDHSISPLLFHMLLGQLLPSKDLGAMLKSPPNGEEGRTVVRAVLKACAWPGDPFLCNQGFGCIPNLKIQNVSESEIFCMQTYHHSGKCHI